MFAVLPAGRPVNTSLTPITPTHFALTLPAQPPINHIAVFLLPDATLPPDIAAAVYFRPPAATEYRFLGAIGEGKESAIFSLRDAAATDSGMVLDSSDGGDGGSGTGTVELGIALEPTAQVAIALGQLQRDEEERKQRRRQEQQNSAMTALITSRSAFPAPADPGATMSDVPPKVMAQRIIQHAFNYLASFAEKRGGGDGAGVAVGGGSGGLNAMEDMIPLSRMREWWVKFEGKLDRDPAFLEKEVGGV
ncbi:MAG: hypothetical protein M1825_004391 [Sarcosagium campestre]|nr:MAG: hypothetical protein M1825_004391 [Sarcosagium campestre]